MLLLSYVTAFTNTSSSSAKPYEFINPFGVVHGYGTGEWVTLCILLGYKIISRQPTALEWITIIFQNEDNQQSFQELHAPTATQCFVNIMSFESDLLDKIDFLISFSASLLRNPERSVSDSEW